MSRWRLPAVPALAVGILATVASLVSVAPAAADCGMQAPPSNLAAYRGTAFVGTVTANEPIELLYLPSRYRSDEIAITFDVERPIRGITDDQTVVIGGEKGNCAHFWASELAVGDRVLISYKPLEDEADFDLAPGTHIAWHALAWRPASDGGWRFAKDVMYGLEFYPPAAKAADTYAEIVALVGPDLPPTDTGPTPPAHELTELVALLAGAAGAAAWLLRSGVRA